MLVFQSNEFGEVRTIELNNKPYFVAIDIAKSLGYKDTTNAIKQHCRWVVKHHIPHPQSKNKTIEANVIPEGDMYRLITNSELPSAEKFESWIFDEVLPQIRQTGGYIPQNENETEEDILAKAILIAQKTIEKKNKIIEEQKPLVSFANKVATSQNSLLVREVAKLASKQGLNIGEKRLWNKLREWGLIFKNTTEPKQYGIDRGYFEVVEGTRENKTGTFTYKTTRVTGKGQVYIISKLQKELA
ncbi:phage antirepressor KilAC domain-containing protein [Clostridium sporogenes]|uniref:Phage antirepressor Ant n=1 Tax=Clostridium sporogenes TaxID=1509 RepID=A0ABX4KFU4_CLOSG|nr:phage antirepressor KilAC domain-containing protein [Clostridium sporogenes]KRU46334.1 KilAC domain-containing phage antirepressor protein [Clostridium sporogenes]MBY7064407.1 phage antirepressor KilAC domain-containing protein [Clostridium sporogenes]MBY7071335.1 phage antirepressor KilAC domain-containing protein [Clostridium sporogenes]MCW6064838.1 phage antirepressor KilAC domain-containing protein [Clostridium sporogenes]NFL80298.1 phage antirepressor Ant [Clostridium sporogenes]